ncbi:hypothetical protein [Aridibaculum aurantiacum]|uniref:hypothetical protein n=1 Tax=Aridibaculum aurantiacum TaxID=2810307 RepID=UPI001A96558E|nr:hypothetical protein [Aridibaculum aurantiacum]
MKPFQPLFLLLLFVQLCFTQSVFAQQKLDHILDMVHHNPGEPLTNSAFTDPAYLKTNGFNGQVINDFTFAHAAVTFDALQKDIFPKGTKERTWVENAAAKVRSNIANAHKAGIKAYYFTDLIVLPKKLVEVYADEILDENGKISLERPKTIELHRLMLDELFQQFPELDGLVIRTGETYLNNVPFHTGNNPITKGEQSHIKLLQLLRDEVCVKRNKKIFYRTWSFGGMHEEPVYYLNVTKNVDPHPNLIFSVKHTKGDYHRTFDFNPTLAIGNHPQVVEVQCQREYEGKGAYPNYVMNGVIEGFEEYATSKPQQGKKSLRDIASSPTFKGVWSWSRGGGWVGPYISNEFWCKVNAFVLSTWAADPSMSEEKAFEQFMDKAGITGSSRQAFRKLSLLSATAVLKGHNSAMQQFDPEWVWWMRDEFLGGINPNTNGAKFDSEGVLYKAFVSYDSMGLLQKAVDEKFEAVKLWHQVVNLSKQVKMKDKADEEYVRLSSNYGLLLHNIIAEGWKIMAIGFQGDKNGKYNTKALAASIANYDKLWQQYRQLKAGNPQVATLYKPNAFVYEAPVYHKEMGMDASVNKYRKLISK